MEKLPVLGFQVSGEPRYFPNNRAKKILKIGYTKKKKQRTCNSYRYLTDVVAKFNRGAIGYF
jgi:hypothetical protein